jgi:glycine cleavage system H protein
MASPADLRYSKSHEWVRPEGDIVTIGITDHAQSELGDIVYIELPEPGRMLAMDEMFGTIESVKAVSELYAPISGEVVESNTLIIDATETVNNDPYQNGWLIKVRPTDTTELEQLMDAAAYDQLIAD